MLTCPATSACTTRNGVAGSVTLAAKSAEQHHAASGMGASLLLQVRPLVRAVDAAFQQFDLQPFHRDPRPHISLAWWQGDKAAAVEAALAKLQAATTQAGCNVSADEATVPKPALPLTKIEEGGNTPVLPFAKGSVAAVLQDAEGSVASVSQGGVTNAAASDTLRQGAAGHVASKKQLDNHGTDSQGNFAHPTRITEWDACRVVANAAVLQCKVGKKVFQVWSAS